MSNSTTKPATPGGRPKKADGERRVRAAKADLTIAEYSHLQKKAAAAGQSVAAYLRERALGPSSSPAPSDEQPERDMLLARLLRELNAVGVNLNQISKAHNAGRDTRTGWKPVQAELLRVLEKVGAEFS